MSDQEPVCACVAESNSDAHLIATFLNDHGITAHAVEDNSPAGMFSLGTLPELYRPKVFVHPASLDNAVDIINRYEQGELKAVSPSIFCYHCGTECQAAATECESRGKPLDLDTEEGPEAAERESYDQNGTLADFRSLKKLLATAMFAPFLFFFFLFIMMAIRGCPGRY